MSAAEEHGELPPWINPAMQQHIAWRNKDIVIAVPPKSGTTWTMNIVYQLLSGGDPDFFDIYAEVPWIEFVTRPGMPVAELLARLERMDAARPRAVKTHSTPSLLGYIEPGTGKDVRYIVVMRNPEEALVSMKPFLAQHSEEWFALWQAPANMFSFPDFPSFYRELADRTGMNRHLFEFLRCWWPLRHQPNVLFLHFNDMKREHLGMLRRIAAFIDIQPSAIEWSAIAEYTSFAWMKQHDSKFDGLSNEPVPPLRPGAMMRKGSAGAAHEDGMTDAIAAELRAIGREICPDERVLHWFYEGGAFV